MRNGIHRADLLADHAGNIAGRLNGDGIEIADKSGFLGANGHTDAAIDAGVPGNGKDDRRGFHSAKFF